MKSRSICICFACCVLAATSNAQGDPAKSKLRIVTLGDSTTFGYSVDNNYPRQLESKLRAHHINAAVINSGINGDTTDGGWLRFDADVLKYTPDAVIIQFGLNDQTNRFYRPTKGLIPYVMLEKYEANLQRFVDALRSRNIKVVLMTPNLMCWTPALKHLYPEGPYLDSPLGGNGLLQKYVAAVRRVARKNNVPLVDISKLYDDFERTSGEPIHAVFLDDGVHPNERGYAMNVEHIFPSLMEMLKCAVNPTRTTASRSEIESTESISNGASASACRNVPQSFANNIRPRTKPRRCFMVQRYKQSAR